MTLTVTVVVVVAVVVAAASVVSESATCADKQRKTSSPAQGLPDTFRSLTSAC